MKKRLPLILICLLAITTVYGQQSISDSVLYSLTLRTIENYTGSSEIRVLESVIIPPALWDKRIKRPRKGRYFKDADLAFINQQINNPAIKTWDTEKFKRARNIRIVKRHGATFKRKDCLFVSLPIFSKDLKTVVIYFETWNKSWFQSGGYGTGFVAVWKLDQKNEWVQGVESKLWLTASHVPAPNRSDAQSPVALFVKR